MSIKNKMLFMAGRTGLYAKKYAPEILMTLGTIGFGATIFASSKATLKVNDILDEHDVAVANIKEAKENGVTLAGEDYDENDYKNDMKNTYVKTIWDVTKLYTPAATMGLVSVGCYLTAHKVMKNRNLAALAMATLAENRLESYRARVVEEHGEQADQDYYNGVRRSKVKVKEVDPETGKKKTVEKEVKEYDSALSPYVVRFNSETAKMWSRVPGANGNFLSYTRDYFQNILDTRGHVFLNEVLDALGMEHTEAGSLTGWIKGHGDDVINFGTLELNSQEDLWDSYDVNSGIDIVLDFNVCGAIYQYMK